MDSYYKAKKEAERITKVLYDRFVKHTAKLCCYVNPMTTTGKFYICLPCLTKIMGPEQRTKEADAQRRS